jgi:hypothetical protein
MGVGGSNTEQRVTWIDSRCPMLVDSGINIVHIMLGTNDSSINLSGNQEGERYKEKIQIIIDTLKGCGVKLVLLSDQPFRRGESSTGTILSNLARYRDANRELI